MNKILNGKIIKRYTKKFRRFKGFKNEHIKFECNITIIFKFIFVFILIISVYNIFTNNIFSIRIIILILIQKKIMIGYKMPKK